jgi:hypothetical protein
MVNTSSRMATHFRYLNCSTAASHTTGQRWSWSYPGTVATSDLGSPGCLMLSRESRSMCAQKKRQTSSKRSGTYLRLPVDGFLDKIHLQESRRPAYSPPSSCTSVVFGTIALKRAQTGMRLPMCWCGCRNGALAQQTTCIEARISSSLETTLLHPPPARRQPLQGFAGRRRGVNIHLHAATVAHPRRMLEPEHGKLL